MMQLFSQPCKILGLALNFKLFFPSAYKALIICHIASKISEESCITDWQWAASREALVKLQEELQETLTGMSQGRWGKLIPENSNTEQILKDVY